MRQVEESVRYMELAKIEELASSFAAQGYRVVKEYKLGTQVVDLVAELGAKRIYVEVKALKHLDSKALKLVRDRVLRNDPNAEFRVVVANPPAAKSIGIESLPEKIRLWLQDHARETIKQQLGTSLHDEVTLISVDDVTDLEIFKLYVSNDAQDHIKASVRGTLVVTFHQNMDEDEDANDNEKTVIFIENRGDIGVVPVELPFESEVSLDGDLQINSMTPQFAVDSITFL